MPEVARAILASGIGGLADSRLSNLRRMKEAGIKVEMLLLRSPALSEATEAVKLAEVSLNSEFEVVASLAQEARALGKLHRVILMVDVGDRREGLLPEDVEGVARKIESLEGIRLLGLGSNVGCLSGISPSPKDTQLLVQLAVRVEEAIGRELAVISGGSSIHLRMVEQGRLPARINQLRIGEGILLGSDPADGRPFSYTSQDAFTLTAEVIEVKWKPALPQRESGHVVLEEHPIREDQALRCRAIVAVGTQDVRIEGLSPRTPGMRIIGASSDHLVLSILVQKKEEVIAENGMVVAESVEAAEAGMEIFEKGGNAFDAAVATSFASCTCEPAMSSLGGGGAALIYLADEDQTVAIEFEGRLPRAATEDMFVPDLLPLGVEPHPSFGWRGTRNNVGWMGYRSLGVPGQVAGLCQILEQFGTMSLEEVTSPNPGTVWHYEPGRSHRTCDKDLRRGLRGQSLLCLDDWQSHETPAAISSY
jgi:predicted amino acid racemase